MLNADERTRAEGFFAHARRKVYDRRESELERVDGVRVGGRKAGVRGVVLQCAEAGLREVL